MRKSEMQGCMKMNEQEAKLLLNFDDEVAQHVLSGFEYQIFYMLKQVAKDKINKNTKQYVMI